MLTLSGFGVCFFLVAESIEQGFVHEGSWNFIGSWSGI